MTSQAVISGDERGISPALVSFIAQTVQAALAGGRSAHSSPPVLTTPPQSMAVEVPNSLGPVSMASSCSGAFCHRWAAQLAIFWKQELDFCNKIGLLFLLIWCLPLFLLL